MNSWFTKSQKDSFYLPVHRTPKGSGPFDPTHRGLLDLVCKLPFHNSGIGGTSDFGVKSRGLLVCGIPKRSEPFWVLGDGVTSGLGHFISNSRLPKYRYS
jgi:hypothetical protein